MSMNDRYEPTSIEPRWQRRWEEAGAFHAGRRPAAEKRYVLEMFPYPSGAMHMGHARVYTIGDALARYLRMRGYDVLHPIGFDALGLPAENAAIKDGRHPAERTAENIVAFRAEMKRLGFAFDWDREVVTADAEYYRWNQWFFLKMLELGLVYRREGKANWCTGCATVIANEQVLADGTCERCSSPVVEKVIPEWAFRITAFAQELLDGLDGLTGWPERIVTMQRNWIGKSVGAEVDFAVPGGPPIKVFTTRVDTIFGCTYVVLAPEHALVDRLTTEEIQFLFRMVKANADLPNFIYFVLFDRDLVERALALISNGRGAQFLQKIVHLGIDVPALDRTRLEKYLEAELEKTFQDTRVSRFFDETRWGNLFVGSLRTYFRTLRDVKRYLSAFTFHADIFLSPEGFDVNPVDLAAIEALRLFEPSVYQGIRSARDALLSIRADSEAPDLRSQIGEIGAKSPPGVQANIRELIQQLFPQVEWVWGRNIQYETSTMDQWSRELRICSASHFDRYFLLALGTNELSTAEADYLVSLSGDRNRLSGALRRLADRGLLPAAIDTLADRVEEIDVRNGVAFLTAVCDMADELPDRRFEDEPGVSFLDAARLVSRYLRQRYESAYRATVFKQVISATSGIAVPVVLVSRESDPAFRSRTPQETFLEEGEVSEIQASCRRTRAPLAPPSAGHPRRSR
jgi:hypothetical protein